MKTSKAGISTRTSGGFTLLEVLAALSIAAIGMLGLIQLQLTSMATATKANHITQATLLAQSLIAEAVGTRTTPPPYQSGTNSQSHPAMHWTVTTEPDTEMSTRLQSKRPVYQVTAKVWWSPVANAQTIELTRLVMPMTSP